MAIISNAKAIELNMAGNAELITVFRKSLEEAKNSLQANKIYREVYILKVF